MQRDGGWAKILAVDDYAAGIQNEVDESDFLPPAH